jgi:hypothetical protein
MTPEAKARYALNYGGERDRLPPEAQDEYDRLSHLSQVEYTRTAPGEKLTPEQTMNRIMIYAHQTAVSTRIIAWIVGIFAALTLIGVIVGIVEVVHALNAINQAQTVP